MLWNVNKNTLPFSRCYDEAWVDRLARGFKRNLTQPYQFSVFTDRYRQFRECVVQYPIIAREPGYGCLIEPFRLNEPMVLVGLDTVVVGNIDHFADYCLSANKVALPRDPYKPEQSINGVALIPAGCQDIYKTWRGENDMEWLRRWDTTFIDDLWPGQAISFKAHKVRDVGLGEARIVYFHGKPKAHQLLDTPWIKQHWLA